MRITFIKNHFYRIFCLLKFVYFNFFIMFFSLTPLKNAPYFISKKLFCVAPSGKCSLRQIKTKKNNLCCQSLGYNSSQPMTTETLVETEKTMPMKPESRPSDQIVSEGLKTDLALSEKPGSQNAQIATAHRVIVITSGKGGVGKTSITANIGMSIARLGYKTVLIDADIGLKNLDLLVGLENRIMYTVMDVFEGRCRLDQALTRDKRWNNLTLLSISKNRQRYNITRKNMDNLVQALINLDYSYILIDCPAGIDVGFINAISPANEAIIVTTPELPALRDADRVAGLLEANSIYDIKLLVNRVRPDLVSSHNMLSIKDVQQALGIPLLGAVPEDLEIILSTNFGEPLVLRKKLTLAGLALETIARRLVGYQTNFLNLDTPYKSAFQRVAGFLLSPFQ